jgi:glycosyltransferase involved in cell wall biosynthesis
MTIADTETDFAPTGKNTSHRRTAECGANQLLANLRIIVVTPLFPPAVGGASEDFRLLTEAWETAGLIEGVVVLTERFKGSPRREQNKKIVVRRVLPPRDTRPRLHVADRALRSATTYLYLLVSIAWELRRRRSQVVLLHCRYGKRGFLKVLKFLGAKVVVCLSDLFTSPAGLADCDAVVCNSENVYKRALSQLPASCLVSFVPLPFEIPRSHPNQGSAAKAPVPYFLFVGNISRPKGVDALLEAFALFRRDRPNYHLILAGPISDPSLLSAATEGVTFLGEVDRKAATALMERAEAVVLPSRSEALPRVCLEAIALGAKVICPPCVPELWRWCPDWVLGAVTAQGILEKLEQTLNPSFSPRFDFEKHDPKLAGQRILEVCAAIIH